MSKVSEAAREFFHLAARDFNPYHDARGRFTNGNGATSFTIQTKDPSKQHWANAAIEREKLRTAGGAVQTRAVNQEEYAKAHKEAQKLASEKEKLSKERGKDFEEAYHARFNGDDDTYNRKMSERKEKAEQMKELDAQMAEAAKNAGIESEVEARAFSSKMQYKEVQRLDSELWDDEIVDKLGGGDKTKGSCSSLAFAYAANQNGLDVTDYRGGSSQDFFSRADNIEGIAHLDGVKSYEARSRNEFNDAHQLLSNVETGGKTYYFAVGKHAAVVRSTSSGQYEYLELQAGYSHYKAGYKNGWYPLTDAKLASRFKVEKSTGRATARVLIDIDSLKGSVDFQQLMGYVNTSPDKQKKGATGYAK